jgi:hypothetical protein
MINRSAEVNEAVGSRIHVVRLVRMGDNQPHIVANLFECSVEDWLGFESGKRVMDQNELIAFSLRFRVDPAFILLGRVDALDEALQSQIIADEPQAEPVNPVFLKFRLRVSDACRVVN